MPARVYTHCTVPGCGNPHYATALCRAHYVSRRNAAARAASKPINAPVLPAAPQPVPAAPPAVVWPTENAAAAFADAWADIEARRKLAAEHGLTPFPPAPVIVPPAPPAAPMLPVVPPAPPRK